MSVIQAKNEAKKIWETHIGEYGKTDPESLAKKLGLKVVYEKLDDEVSGVLVLQESRPVIFVNAEQHSNRQRFTISHELGHYLLHKQEQVHVDNDFTVVYRNTKSSTGEDLHEIEANQFAAELLMPEKCVGQYIVDNKVRVITETTIANMADFFGVSLQAMTIRLSAIGLI
ncbi:MAG: ImmA/IrrE family metallo-endopeptidase [Deltaproteobacteria bacterium]|nr:ImmA/IrrE family metallo-endopeptidase [Deltaproteobacteria bacterium]